MWKVCVTSDGFFNQFSALGASVRVHRRGTGGRGHDQIVHGKSYRSRRLSTPVDLFEQPPQFGAAGRIDLFDPAYAAVEPVCRASEPNGELQRIVKVLHAKGVCD